MRKKLSLQWKLTLLTALLVTAACLVLSGIVSFNALSHMDQISDTISMSIPKEGIAGDASGETDELVIDINGSLAKELARNQNLFQTHSVIITILIVLAGSTATYFIVGYALKPLKKLEQQVEEIQVQSISQPLQVESSSEEIEKLGEAFNDMLQRMEKAFASQRQFSANAAHELRTPLAVLQTRLEVFQKQPEHTMQEYDEAMDMVYTQAERLSHVIDVLLEMTQLESAEKTDQISLSAIVEEVLCDLEAVASKKDIILEQNSGEAVIMGSDILIYRAIYNLVENAIKYNQIGGKVSVDIKESDGFARVFISDTGIGIQKQDQEKIFEPFYRVDKSRSRAMGGAGLGLALVQKIAVLHGGSVKIVKSNARGTSVEFCASSKIQ